MIQLFEDLRFVIGLFFAIISVILLVAGWTHPSSPQTQFINLNLVAGIYIGLFSMFMMSLGMMARKRAAVKADTSLTST